MVGLRRGGISWRRTMDEQWIANFNDRHKIMELVVADMGSFARRCF